MVTQAQQPGWLPRLQDPTWNFVRRLWVPKAGQEAKPFPGSFRTKASSHSPMDLPWDTLCNAVLCAGPEQSGLGNEQVLSLLFLKILGQFFFNLFILIGG